MKGGKGAFHSMKGQAGRSALLKLSGGNSVVVLNFLQSQKMSLIKSPLFSLSKVGRYVNEG